MPKRHYFTGSKQEALSNTTVDYITLDRVPEGFEYHYDAVSATDLDNAPTGNIEIGILHHGEFLVFWSESISAAGNYVTCRRPLVVTAGDQLQVAFKGITAGDKCKVNYNGYWVQTGKEE